MSLIYEAENSDFIFYHAKTFMCKNWAKLSPFKQSLKKGVVWLKISVISAWKIPLTYLSNSSRTQSHPVGYQHHQYFPSHIPHPLSSFWLDIKWNTNPLFGQLNIFKYVCSFFYPQIQGGAALSKIFLNSLLLFEDK